jgi:hypothetical protein
LSFTQKRHHDAAEGVQGSSPRRLLLLERGLGVIETARSRMAQEFAENLGRRIAAGRIRAGTGEPSAALIDTVDDSPSMERLARGRLRAANNPPA